jgi:mRNA interferase RelE/StbE
MYKLLFSEVAKKDLEKFTIDERIFIAEKLKYLAGNFELLKQTKKVRRLIIQGIKSEVENGNKNAQTH